MPKNGTLPINDDLDVDIHGVDPDMHASQVNLFNEGMSFIALKTETGGEQSEPSSKMIRRRKSKHSLKASIERDKDNSNRKPKKEKRVKMMDDDAK